MNDNERRIKLAMQDSINELTARAWSIPSKSSGTISTAPGLSLNELIEVINKTKPVVVCISEFMPNDDEIFKLAPNEFEQRTMLVMSKEAFKRVEVLVSDIRNWAEIRMPKEK